jgi:hypothetical protein
VKAAEVDDMPSRFSSPSDSVRPLANAERDMRVLVRVEKADLDQEAGRPVSQMEQDLFRVCLQDVIRSQWPLAGAHVMIGGIREDEILQYPGQVTVLAPVGDDVRGRVRAMREGLLANSALWLAGSRGR